MKETNTVSTVDRCMKDDCLTRNGFYVFFPDKTYGIYSLVYKIKDLVIYGNNQISNNSGSIYSDVTMSGCNWESNIDYYNVPQQTTELSDLEMYKTDRATGDNFFIYKDTNNPQLKLFYNKYINGFPNWHEYSEMESKPLNYQDFVKSFPIILWTDPFGRTLRFINLEFVTPNMCEPIVYLYNNSNLNVKVTLGDKVKTSYTWPQYNSGWNLTVYPGSRIFNNMDGKLYPYLFWEGSSYYLPIIEKGTVMRKVEVESYFDKSLTQLGLIESEIRDFKDAWLPKFKNYPYYQIYFYDQEIIDIIAPLNVDPKPQTSIRVLMDYRGLNSGIEFKPQTFNEKTPSRNGFTLVEWGGFGRPY